MSRFVWLRGQFSILALTPDSAQSSSRSGPKLWPRRFASAPTNPRPTRTRKQANSRTKRSTRAPANNQTQARPSLRIRRHAPSCSRSPAGTRGRARWASCWRPGSWMRDSCTRDSWSDGGTSARPRWNSSRSPRSRSARATEEAASRRRRRAPSPRSSSSNNSRIGDGG